MDWSSGDYTSAEGGLFRVPEDDSEAGVYLRDGRGARSCDGFRGGPRGERRERYYTGGNVVSERRGGERHGVSWDERPPAFRPSSGGAEARLVPPPMREGFAACGAAPPACAPACSAAAPACGAAACGAAPACGAAACGAAACGAAACGAAACGAAACGAAHSLRLIKAVLLVVVVVLLALALAAAAGAARSLEKAVREALGALAAARAL